MGAFGGKLVAKPSDGRKRISFAEEGENSNDDDDENDETPHSKRDVLKDLRMSSRTISLTEDEVDKIFDDVFATPQERERQVTLTEIAAKHDSIGNDEIEAMGYSTRRSKRYSSATIARAVAAALVLILIGLASWEVGREQAPKTRDSADSTSASVSANQTNGHDVNQETRGGETPAAGVANTSHFPIVNVAAEKTFTQEGDLSEPNAIPGKDIGPYLIGFVEQPIDPAEIQVLLKHDLTKDLRVIGTEAAKFDTSETVTVKVDDYDLQCGVKVDQVPLTLICSFNELCGVYLVGATYCDKYE